MSGPDRTGIADVADGGQKPEESAADRDDRTSVKSAAAAAGEMSATTCAAEQPRGQALPQQQAVFSIDPSSAQRKTVKNIQSVIPRNR